jgi:O-antigen/teichoic acid export membrane protein
MELAANQGINSGLVYFASSLLERDNSRVAGFFKTAFIAKVGAALLLLFAGLLVVDPIFTQWLHKPELKMFVWFGIIGACFASLWWYTLSVLQSYRSFNKYTLLHLMPNVFTFMLVSIFAFTSRLTLVAALYVKIFGFLASLLAGLLFIPRRFLHPRGSDRSTARELLRYSKWTTTASLLTVLFHRQDIVLLGLIVEPTTLGYYAAAATVAAILYLLYDASVAVLLPVASRLSGRDQYLRFVRKSLMMMGGLCLAVIPIFIWIEPLIVTIYTESFLPSVPIFRVLFVGLIFTMLLEPLTVILYATQKPQWITAVNLLVVIIYTTGNLLLIPRYGAMGAAGMTVVARFLSGVIILVLAFYVVIKMKPRETEVMPYPTRIGQEA